MKKSCKILCLMLVIFMMTGCVKIQADMAINKDKSMNFSLIYAVENSLVEQTGSESPLEGDMVKKAEKQGFQAEEYSEGSMVGFKLTKKIDNIDDVSSEKEVNYSLESTLNDSEQTDMFTVKKGFFKNTYTLKMENKSSEEVQDGMNSVSDSNETNRLEDQTTDTNTATDTTQNDISDLSMLSSSIDMKFNISLPYKAISSNATSTENDGKNLKWNLLDSNFQNVTAQFELYNINNIYLTIGIVAAIIIIIVILIIKKRKPKASIGTPVPVEDQPLNNINQNLQSVTPVTNVNANQTVTETNRSTINTNISQEPLNQNTQTTDYTIETLDMDDTSEEAPYTSDFVATPAPQVIPTPSTSPTTPIIPTIQESEVETLELESEPTPVQPLDTQDENNNVR